MAESSPFETINASVARLRRRLRIRALIVAIGWILGSVSGLSILALMLMPTPFQMSGSEPYSRLCPFWLVSAFFIGFSGECGQQPHRPRRSRYWEREDPTLGDGLIASVQFADEWDESSEALEKRRSNWQAGLKTVCRVRM